MTDRTENIEPPTISLVALADRFIEDHTRMPNRAFAFVLGAGASRASGIKAAGQMAEDWVRALYREATGDIEGDGKGWATAATLGIKSYAPSDPAGSYSELYHRMYARDADRGYAYLEEQMRDAEPSYGYSVLARIMENTQHKIVVTTNFDNLVADALSIFGKTYPLVCGHESLAGFISPRVRRPLVVKVHRDLLLAPKSDPKELEKLPDGFRAALAQLFGHYTPIVIGYGGNDGSLMGFFKGLPANAIPGGVYWCYWDGGDPPSADIRRFVAEQNGSLVPIPGFDETMLLLGEQLGFDVPEKYVLERASVRAKRIVDQVNALKEKLRTNRHRIPAASVDDPKTRQGASSPDAPEPAKSALDSAETDALSLALTQTMRRTSGALRWWQWQERADAATGVDERDRIYREAVAALPESADLLGNYAIFLKNVRKDYDKAEMYYARALNIDPGHANNLNNYAIFLESIRRNYEKAEAYYIRATEADPENANSQSNYAVFLKNIRNDYNKAEKYFSRALEIHPEDAYILGSYANFLADIRKNFDLAETYYVRALEADPWDVHLLGSYANFLADIRKNFDLAETYYIRALEVNPAHAVSLGRYAFFLQDVRKDYDRAEAQYVRALEVDPNDANSLGNYANFLVDVRKNNDKAEAHYIRAVGADPGDRNTLGNYAKLLLATGKVEEGLSMLGRAFATPGENMPEQLAVELHMYAVCHQLPTTWRAALASLKRLLLEEKISTGDWDFSGVIESAKKRGHPAAEWLEPLAAVCAGTADASALDGWEEWRRA